MKSLYACACCLAVAVLVVPASARPTAPKRNGLIAFVTHNASSANGIAAVRPDGNGRRMFTRDSRDRSPAWSGNGASLAFERAGRLYLIRSDGSGLKPLEPAGVHRDTEPAWSPDGRSIAFVRDERSLMVMRVTGSGARRLDSVAGGGWIDGPAWSPDGRWIAFGLNEDACDGGSIVVIRANGGGGMRRVTDGCITDALGALDPGGGADDSDPAWSPDGTRIAFTRVVWLCGSCDQEEIFVSNVDGSNVRWVTRDTRFAAASPAWSPDGKRLVGVMGAVAILDLAGKAIRNLDPSGAEPAWQPNP